VSARTADGVEPLFHAAAQLGVPTAIERLEESLQQSVNKRYKFNFNYKHVFYNHHFTIIFFSSRCQIWSPCNSDNIQNAYVVRILFCVDKLFSE